MPPEDNPQDDIQPTKEEWEAMTSHTPGPWLAHHSGEHSYVTASVPPRLHANTVIVCVGFLDDFPGQYAGRDANAANAHLIAAAPDLLRMCEAASKALRSYQYGNSAPALAEEIADTVDAAIAKAKG